MNDFSERFTSIANHTKPPGSDPHTVAETIRKTGLIPESKLPFDDSIKTLEQYYSPDPLPAYLLSIGQDWLTNYTFKHEFVIGTADDWMDALQYSPLGVSVFAWAQSNGLYVRPPGIADNHWVCCYGYVKDQYWKIFDSYDQTHKRLEWNFGFTFVKRYYVEKKVILPPLPPPVKKSWWQRFLEFLRIIFVWK